MTGSRKSSSDDYIFVNGRAVRADETAYLDVGTTPVPGQERSEDGKLKRRIRDLQESDAFAAPDAQGERAVSLNETERQQAIEQHRFKRRCLIAGIALIAVALFSLMLPHVEMTQTGARLYPPGEVLHCYQLFLQKNVVPFFDPSQGTELALRSVNAEITSLDYYEGIINRFGITVLDIICGFMLAVSGMLFQTSFRNPLAAPSTLGATEGVNLGYLVFFLLGYNTMADNPAVYYLVVYGSGVASLAAVLLLSRYVNGAKRFNVFDMLLVGTVLAQLLNAIFLFFESMLQQDQIDTIFMMQSASGMVQSGYTYAAILIAAAVTLVPTFLMRFKLNLVSFPDEESRLLGVNPRRLRFAALALGSIMVVAAVATVGNVAMLSLAIPFLTRYMFGAEVGKQLTGNFFLGSLVLLVCSDLSTCITVNGLSTPVGTLVTFVTMPFIAWMMVLQRRTWE
ncbi:MAG: iron ABC transporter permease [Coriobacteriales bacterium]